MDLEEVGQRLLSNLCKSCRAFCEECSPTPYNELTKFPVKQTKAGLEHGLKNGCRLCPVLWYSVLTMTDNRIIDMNSKGWEECEATYDMELHYRIEDCSTTDYPSYSLCVYSLEDDSWIPDERRPKTGITPGEPMFIGEIRKISPGECTATDDH